jgi:DNA mismatch repair protein MutS
VQNRPISQAPGKAGPSPVEVALTDVVPDALTPRDALETLYRLKALLNDKA